MRAKYKTPTVTQVSPETNVSYLCVDKDGDEFIYDEIPKRCEEMWSLAHSEFGDMVALPSGMIKKMIGKSLSWNDEPYKIKEDECQTEN